MIPYSYADQVLLSTLLHGLQTVFEFFAESSLPSVIFIAIAFHSAGRIDPSHIRFRTSTSLWARGAGLLAVLSFCLTAYFVTEPSGDDLPHFVGLGFRALPVFITAQGVAAIALGLFGWFRWLVALPFRWSSSALAWAKRRLPTLLPRPKQPIVEIHPPPLPPTLESQIAQAKQQFEATVATLRAAGLDEDELDTAVLAARQKYVRTLHGVLKYEVP